MGIGVGWGGAGRIGGRVLAAVLRFRHPRHLANERVLASCGSYVIIIAATAFRVDHTDRSPGVAGIRPS